MNKRINKTGPPKGSWLIAGGTFALLSLLLYACQAAATPAPTLLPEPAVVPTSTPLPDQSEYLTAWESGPHSADWDVGKGPNTMCTRCHSPQNWEPDSRPGRPPSCVTCKFPTDAEMRMAPSLAEGGMDFIGEEDWVGIPCAQCHEVDENGIASEKIAWLNPKSATYEPLNTPNELCTKCHVDSAGNKGSGGNGVDHSIVLGGSAHANFAGEWPQADRPKYCTDCHDAHSNETKQCVDCHTNTDEMHAKIPAMHETVTCMACHDASGVDVGRVEEGGPFTTVLITPASARGPASTTEIVSHSIVWKVSCNRCHFEGNTWDLPVLTATGAVPATPTPTP